MLILSFLWKMINQDGLSSWKRAISCYLFPKKIVLDNNIENLVNLRMNCKHEIWL